MTVARSADVLIVGAGPAGAAASTALASRGVNVLLADARAGDRADTQAGAQAAEDHDVMLSGPGIQGLMSLGIATGPLIRPADVIELRFGADAGGVVGDACAGVCTGGGLREALRQAAATAGAVRIQGAVTSLARHEDGYLATIGSMAIEARHVIVAAGAAGVSPADAGPDNVGADGRGLALPESAAGTVGLGCARRFSGARLGTRILLAMTAPGTSGPGERPTCVWALPGTDCTVTLAVARIGDPRSASPAATGPARGGPARGGPAVDDPAELLARAASWLADCDPRFSAIQSAGPVISGPLHTGFTPERLAQADYLLAGDAAGLVNPFTGEGLSYALRSGLLAADAIASRLADPEAARRAYARRLTGGFVGYFETARHAARRYHLTWRVLAAASVSDRPFFAMARRAILLPEGRAGLAAADSIRPQGRDALITGPFLVSCDEVEITTIRKEWPFLARMLTSGTGMTRHRLRPALLFLAALLAEGNTLDIKRATPGAAIELATLGALAFVGQAAPRQATGEDDGQDAVRGGRLDADSGTRQDVGSCDGRDTDRSTGLRADRGVDWTATTTVLAGDFLLAQASRLIAESAPEISWSFADWLAELTALRAAQLSPAPGGSANSGAAGRDNAAKGIAYQDSGSIGKGDAQARERDTGAGAVFASLFEFPARIGALLGGGSQQTVRALRDFGHHCGHAYLHAEDILALRGERTRLDTTLSGLLQGRISAIPEVLSQDNHNGGDRRDSGSSASTARAGTGHFLTGSASTTPIGAGLLLTNPEVHEAALAASDAACRRAAQHALKAASAVSGPLAARILRDFITAIAAPVIAP